jgi:hypothetical protein
MGLQGVHPEARQLLQLAEWGERRNDRGVPVDKCPWRAGIDDPQCWWLSCERHGRNELGNESAGVPSDEIAEEVAKARWTCEHHFIAEHPGITPLPAVAEFLGISRQTLQDRLIPAWAALLEAADDYAEELGEDEVEQYDRRQFAKRLQRLGVTPDFLLEDAEPAPEPPAPEEEEATVEESAPKFHADTEERFLSKLGAGVKS